GFAMNWPLLGTGILLLSSGLEAANIYVTSTVQKVDGKNGCSLQEAIYSANWQTNQAITYSGAIVTTQCVSGTGNDTIVLPAKATFSMSVPIPDQFNYLGWTATPLIISNVTIEANGSTLDGGGSGRVRAFAVGDQSESIPAAGVNVAGTGSLTIRNAY